MQPVRVSIATLNMWGVARWPDRAPAIRQFLDLYRPDVFCVQELHRETRLFLDRELRNHDRIHDDFTGWTVEGNIYWDRELFEKETHGAEDIGLLEANRRLFWVRLKLKDKNLSLVVSTAHFSYQEHPLERQTGQSPRLESAHRTVTALTSIANSEEPVFFMGDLNDTIHPTLILHDAGLSSCFVKLEMLSPVTFPAYPTARSRSQDPVYFLPQTRDWIFANQFARPLMAQVPHCYSDDLALSDHWPVVAIYEILENEN